jgi:ABC-type phosphate transport system auxiliary subunit
MNYDWAYIASGAVALAVIAAIALILAFAVFGKRESMGNQEPPWKRRHPFMEQ